MFVARTKKKGSESAVHVHEPQKVLERGERDFEFVSRESSLGIKPERNYGYNAFFGEPGDDEWARERSAVYCADYLERYSLLTFGLPSLGTVIKHLKRFDAPDYGLTDFGLQYWIEALATVKKNEWGGTRRRWQRWTPLGVSEESLPSFPGIYYRSQGFKDKKQAETAMISDASQLAYDIYAGKKPLARPCALFGRGKRKSGDEVAGLVGNFKAGRLVMAVDGREHCLMAPVAERLFEFHADNQLKTEICVGMSFQNRGTTVFLANFTRDLVFKENAQRERFLGKEPSLSSINEMDRWLEDFVSNHEFDYRYFVLDLSRQDSSIGSFLIRAFFDWARNSFFCIGQKEKKNFGRYFHWIEEFLIHTRIALPDGQIWVKHKGNVSGSPLTTLTNSYTALCAARTVFGFLLGPGRQEDIVARVYGDNILIGVPRQGTMHWGLPEVVEVWNIFFEQEINPDESYEADSIFHYYGKEPGKSISFLSKHFMQGGGIWRSTEDTVAAMIAPDSDDKGWTARYARACGLMADNPFNIEATFYLERILDELEDRGVLTGQLPPRESQRFRYRLMGTDGETWASRQTVLFCQMLYEVTSEYRVQTRLTAGGMSDSLDEWAQRLYEHSTEWRAV